MKSSYPNKTSYDLISAILKFKPNNLFDILAKRSLELENQRGKPLVEYLIIISNTKAWIPVSILSSYTSKEISKFNKLVQTENQLKNEVIEHWNQNHNVQRLLLDFNVLKN
ncbi:hypothetical protein ACTFIZ_001846 [Dictyostelium cf. discoideum]